MLGLCTNETAQHCGGITRRQLLTAGSIGFGGFTLPGLLRAESQLADGALSGGGSRSVRRPKAKSVIILYLSGGPSQLDMWDMKPEAPREIRGTFEPIATNVSGIHVSEHLPRMASLADKYTIVRSMSHDETDHLRGGYLVWTGDRLQRPIVQGSGMDRRDRPHVGSALHKLLGSSTTMPPFVTVPEFVSPVGVSRPGQHGGFLGAKFDPYLIHSNPNLSDYSPGPLAASGDVPTARLEDRRALLSLINRQRRHLEQTAAARDLSPYYNKAFDLLSTSAAQRAFDVTAETADTRDRYGRHIFGQSTLIARRLVEAGVRLVQVNFIRHDDGKGGQGYDSHSVPPYPKHLDWAKTALLPPTDHAFAALIEDLSERGLLDETLVIMMGEFGRTPRFNKNGGRDHWPACYSLVLAGGGIPGGRVYGASDKIAAAPKANPLAPEGLLATMYHLLGVNPGAEIHDQQKRPNRLVSAGPVFGLL